MISAVPLRFIRFILILYFFFGGGGDYVYTAVLWTWAQTIHIIAQRVWESQENTGKKGFQMVSFHHQKNLSKQQYVYLLTE